jgi:hypothetical protein
MSEEKKAPRKRKPKVVKLPRMYQTRMPFDGGELIVYCVKPITIANLNWVLDQFKRELLEGTPP